MPARLRGRGNSYGGHASTLTPIYPGGDEFNLCKSRVPALHTVPNHPHRSSSIPHQLCTALEEKANTSTPGVS